MEDWNTIYTFGKNGWFNYQNLYDMASEKYKNEIFVEIGVFQGMSLSYLMLKSSSKCYGVDTFKGDPENPNEQRIIKDNKLDLEQITLDNMALLGLEPNLIVSDSVAAADHFKDRECAFVFIDGGHHYEQVIKDIDAWLPKVKQGGIFAGHDYDAPGVREAVLEKFKNKANQMDSCWWIQV